MDKFLNGVQSFLHSVTTNDRYASYDRKGYGRSRPSQRGGVAPGNSDLEAATEYGGADPALVRGDDRMARVGILHDNTSMDSVGRSSLYGSRAGSRTNLATTGANTSNGSSGSGGGSGRVSYTPGMRSQQVGNGIPLEDYAEGGAPPPPAPALSWKRIDRWVESNYPELYDQLSEPVTPADLNEIEMDLDCSLPLDVRDSYMVHDGQERGGRPTGLFFGITFLDLESVVEEWTAWKNTAVRLNNIAQRQAAGSRTVSGASTSSMPPPPPPGQQPQLPQPQKGRPRGTPFTERQESVPDGHIQKVYAHPAWIPLAKDFEGNNIGVDLAPGPSGRWGQVILFGRNFDRKYAIAPSWASFLATFAEDLYSGDHYIDDDLEDGAFIFRAPNGRQMSYFDVLRGRVERTLRAQKRNAHAQPRNSSSRGPSAQQQRAAVGGSLISPVGSTTNLTSTDKPATSSLSKSDAPGDKEAVEDQVLTPEPSKEPSEAQQQPSVEPQVKDDDAKNEPNGGSEPRISNGTSEDAPSSSIPPEDVAAKAKSKKNKKKNNKSADKADDVAADNDDAKDEVDLLQDDLSEVEM